MTARTPLPDDVAVVRESAVLRALDVKLRGYREARVQARGVAAELPALSGLVHFDLWQNDLAIARAISRAEHSLQEIAREREGWE